METTQTRPTPNDLFTVREVMMLFKISRKTVHNWTVRGQLRPLKFGGRKLLFLRGDLQSLISR